jgi:hypothetical protein
MANISVTELLFDADFVDPVTVLRNMELVGPDGIVTYAEAAIPIVASVQSSAGDSLMMTPDLARSGSTYDIITTFPLATATDANKADTVIWRGIEFVVTGVARFGNFANNAGHYEGTMEAKTISPPAGPP